VEIRSFESLPSTQLWLTEAIRKGEVKGSLAVITERQTDGVGSRENRWIGRRGDFFASVALEKESLPDDLPEISASLYFAWLIREALLPLSSDLWIKWPNDLYRGEKKVGGVLTHRLRNFCVVGIGINLKKSENFFEALETELPPMILLDMFLERFKKPPKWKDIFRKYRLEFDRNRRFSAHAGGETISLENARLLEDGSLSIEGKRIVSLR